MVKELKGDLCVIGGGLAGLSAAISAARNGLKVILVHDRPMLGGNASSEVRMWVRGASVRFPDYREGGIVEELAMDNMYQLLPCGEGRIEGQQNANEETNDGSREHRKLFGKILCQALGGDFAKNKYHNGNNNGSYCGSRRVTVH